MSRSREFVKSLVGPHVVFGFVVGVFQALSAPGAGGLFGALAFGAATGAAAVLAKRLTGNTLVSACAAGVMALHPHVLLELAFPVSTQSQAANLLSAACGLLAAGVRLLPSAELENGPLFGRREWMALALLVAGAIAGPVILAMPLLILVSDLAFAPGGVRAVLRRTGAHFFLHVAAVAPAAIMLPTISEADRTSFGSEWMLSEARILGVFDPFMNPFWSLERARDVVANTGPLFVLAVITSILVLLFRRRIPQSLVVTAAFAVTWTVLAQLPRLLLPSGALVINAVLAVFGFSLLLAAILWRLSVAITNPARAPSFEETPIPSVPALRDLIRRMRGDGRAAAAPAARAESAAGMRSTVEGAVAGAVAATLEQIRLAFRGPQRTEPPGTPEQVLWNRLMTGTTAGPALEEKPGAAEARWHDLYAKHVAPRVAPGARVLCAGATPWPLVAALAGPARSVTLVERGARPAQIAAADLAGARNAMVVRHDGRGLAAIGDATVDVVVSLVEPTVELAADLFVLLREAKRVLKAGGLAAIGFADLALPAAREALARTSSGACFTNKEGIEALARLAGLGAVEIAPGAFGATSIAWIRS